MDKHPLWRPCSWNFFLFIHICKHGLVACGHKWPGHFLATWGGLADSLIGSQIEDQLSDLKIQDFASQIRGGCGTFCKATRKCWWYLILGKEFLYILIIHFKYPEGPSTQSLFVTTNSVLQPLSSEREQAHSASFFLSGPLTCKCPPAIRHQQRAVGEKNPTELKCQ